jgi:hypothetical protein
VLQQLIEEATTDARLKVWLAAERSQPHLVVRCSRSRLESLGRQVMKAAPAPVRWCALPGALRLPADRTGTLVLFDVAALQLDQQISLFDWLGPRSGAIRVVALTAERMDRLVESGAFLEGLFHRLGSVQLHVAGGPKDIPSIDRVNRVRNSSERLTNEEKGGVSWSDAW